jgi:acyl carrier protein
MTTIEVVDAVRERLALLLDIPVDSIDDDAQFAGLGVDSLMVLELVALIEQGMGFDIVEEDLSRLRCLSDVERYVDAVARA